MRITNGHRAAYCALVLCGQSAGKISEILGIAVKTIRRAVPVDWSPVRASPRTASLEEYRQKWAALIAFHDHGKRSIREVAIHLDMDRTSVRRILQRAGVHKRRPPGWSRLPPMSAKQRRLRIKLMANGIGRAEATAVALQGPAP